MRTISLALFCTALALAQADLVLRNGKVGTMDPDHPVAQAIAALGDTILAVGSDADMKTITGPNTKVIDLGGKLAIPGFIEGHGHFMGVGESKMMLNLRDAKNWEQIVAMVAA